LSIVPVLLLALRNVAQARKVQKAFVWLEDQEPVKESYVEQPTDSVTSEENN